MADNTYSDPIGLLEFLARNLVTLEEGISINPIFSSDSLVLELSVEEEDIGRMIGKGGRVVRTIRTLLQSISHKDFYIEGKEEVFQRITLEVIS